MSRRQQHTHRGHCQACGRVQAIERGPGVDLRLGTIAKHGYTVDWGYFSGTCNGAGHPALEFDRTQLDATRKALLVYAIGQDTRARKLRDRTAATPERIVTGSKANPEYKGYERGASRFIDVLTPWAECTDAQRDRWYSSATFAAELHAKRARSHRKFLHELAERVHGTEPQAVERAPRLPEPKVGDEFTRYDTQWRVIGPPCLRGMGRGTRYVRCLRLDNSKEAMMRVADVRKLIGSK
jgi:hypothetical protein